MSPRTQEQFEAIRSSRKFEIMESAMEVFVEVGYHKASMAEIARKAAVSKGLIYNYFASKEALLKEVIFLGVEGLKDVFVNIDEELDTPEELRIFIRGSIDLMRSESHFYKLYFLVLFQPEVYAIVQQNFQAIMGDVIERVAYYFKLKGDPYPMDKAFLLGATLDGLGLHYMMSPDHFDLDKYEQIIYDLFK